MADYRQGTGGYELTWQDISTPCAQVPNTISISHLYKNLIISFSGVLQSAPALLGPWKDTSNISPTSVLVTEIEQFYRAKSVKTIAFEYLGSNGNMAPILYTNSSGEFSQVLAFAGQVQLFVTNDPSVMSVQSFAESYGGQIIAQIPSLGYYLVKVAPGDESRFISLANDDVNIGLAVPNIPLVPFSDIVALSDIIGPNGQLPGSDPFSKNDPSVGNNTALYHPDDYHNTTIACGSRFLSHGALTQPYASQGLSGTGEQIDISLSSSQDMVMALDVIRLSIMNNPSRRNVVSLSWGTSGISQADLLRGIVLLLAHLKPADLQRTVFVVAAGNGPGNGTKPGYDFSAAITYLHKNFPTVFGASPHMIVVGGQGPTSGYDPNLNYAQVSVDADGLPLMVYALARNVPVIPDEVCTVDGTSLAAASTSSIIAQLLAGNPTLSLEQVTAAFMQAARSNPKSPNWVPTVSQVEQVLNPPTTVRSHTMTSVPGVKDDCSTPPSVYTFPPSAAEADSWLLVDNVQAGSAIEWDWYRPDGVLYTSSIENFPNAGSFCVAMPLFIAGYVPSSRPGIWSVKVFYNKTQLLFSESFVITGLGRCDGLAPVNACGPCNSSGDCGGGDCWTSSPIPPFCQ